MHFNANKSGAELNNSFSIRFNSRVHVTVVGVAIAFKKKKAGRFDLSHTHNFSGGWGGGMDSV